MMFRNKFVTDAVKDVDTKKGVLVSYVSIFDNEDSHGDVISKSAYNQTIKDDFSRVQFLFNHDPNKIIGKPLSLKTDAKGLIATSQVTKAYGGDYLTLLAEGALREFSVKIELTDYKENPNTNGYLISATKLWEYSAVTWGANSETEVMSLKSQIDSIDSLFSNGKLRDDTFEMLVGLRQKLDEVIKLSKPQPQTTIELESYFTNLKI